MMEFCLFHWKFPTCSSGYVYNSFENIHQKFLLNAQKPLFSEFFSEKVIQKVSSGHVETTPVVFANIRQRFFRSKSVKNVICFFKTDIANFPQDTYTQLYKHQLTIFRSNHQTFFCIKLQKFRKNSLKDLLLVFKNSNLSETSQLLSKQNQESREGTSGHVKSFFGKSVKNCRSKCKTNWLL